MGVIQAALEDVVEADAPAQPSSSRQETEGEFEERMRRAVAAVQGFHDQEDNGDWPEIKADPDIPF
jgi:hypothetical protein